MPLVRGHAAQLGASALTKVQLAPRPHLQLLARPLTNSLRLQAQQKDDQSNAAGPAAPAPVNGQQPGSSEPARGREYYSGLLTTDLRNTNDASSADMLKRSLQLAGELLLQSATRAANMLSNSLSQLAVGVWRMVTCLTAS